MAFTATFYHAGSSEPIGINIGGEPVQLFYDQRPGQERVLAVVEVDAEGGLDLFEIRDKAVVEGAVSVEPEKHFVADTYAYSIGYGDQAKTSFCPKPLVYGTIVLQHLMRDGLPGYEHN